jgi:homogentisate 1,2-dioxygenase
MKNAFKPAAAGTNEVAVMIDTRDALDVSEDAEKVEWLGYVDSWKPK